MADSCSLLGYKESTQYKEILILAMFRHMIQDAACDVFRDIKKHRAQSDVPTGQMSKDFITLIDVGLEILDEKEIKIYSDFIAKKFGYKPEAFYESVQDQATLGMLGCDLNSEEKRMEVLTKVCSTIMNSTPK